MSKCAMDGLPCNCQPEEGVWCRHKATNDALRAELDAACELLREARDEIAYFVPHSGDVVARIDAALNGGKNEKNT